MTQLGIYNTCAGLNTSILVWTALPDGSNTARAHVYGRTDISKISHERYVRDHVQRARTGPATAPRTPVSPQWTHATQTYMKVTTCDARASPKRPKTHALVTVRTTEQGENHGPARASPPARDAVETRPRHTTYTLDTAPTLGVVGVKKTPTSHWICCCHSSSRRSCLAYSQTQPMATDAAG